MGRCWFTGPESQVCKMKGALEGDGGTGRASTQCHLWASATLSALKEGENSTFYVICSSLQFKETKKHRKAEIQQHK